MLELFYFLVYFVLPTLGALALAVATGALVGCLLLRLVRSTRLGKWIGQTDADREVALVVLAIVVFVAAYVLFACLAARAKFTIWSLNLSAQIRKCDANGQIVYEDNFLSDHPSIPAEVFQAAARLKPAIIRELWLRIMLPGPKCGPCYILNESDCKMYIYYIDSGNPHNFVLLAGICAGLGSGWAFWRLTRTPGSGGC